MVRKRRPVGTLREHDGRGFGVAPKPLAANRPETPSADDATADGHVFAQQGQLRIGGAETLHPAVFEAEVGGGLRHGLVFLFRHAAVKWRRLDRLVRRRVLFPCPS